MFFLSSGSYIIWFSLFTFSFHSLAYPTRSTCQCQSFHSTFPPSSVSSLNDANDACTPFVALTPRGSYEFTDSGLELYLDKPQGDYKTKGWVNSKVADGATINSTFSMKTGKVTFDVSAPDVPGVVMAMILIDANENPPNTSPSKAEIREDEIDIELLGGDPSYWQTNIFMRSRADPDYHYGAFSSKEKVDSITNEHSYSIYVDEEKIVWGMDGKDVRTLKKEDTYINGIPHFPRDELRLQMAVWDGSGAQGTSKWSKGPIQWNKAPDRITATLRSVTVEC